MLVNNSLQLSCWLLRAQHSDDSTGSFNMRPVLHCLYYLSDRIVAQTLNTSLDDKVKQLIAAEVQISST